MDAPLQDTTRITRRTTEAELTVQRNLNGTGTLTHQKLNRKGEAEGDPVVLELDKVMFYWLASIGLDAVIKQISG